MKNPISITETTIDFDNYFLEECLSEDAKEKLNTVEILAVPANYEGNGYCFGQETIDFIKYCRQSDSEHTYDILADEIKTMSLHSFDIWMPIIKIASCVLLPLAINMVSNYIWEKCKGREKENAKVDVTILVENNGKKKSIHYNGDAKTFKDSFEKIDLSKL